MLHAADAGARKGAGLLRLAPCPWQAAPTARCSSRGGASAPAGARPAAGAAGRLGLRGARWARLLLREAAAEVEGAGGLLRAGAKSVRAALLCGRDVLILRVLNL
jgi:hypothetical protein